MAQGTSATAASSCGPRAPRADMRSAHALEGLGLGRVRVRIRVRIELCPCPGSVRVRKG